jgi:hypothetical protein
MGSAMDTTEQAGIVLGSASGAIMGTVFGGLWLGLNLFFANALSWLRGPAFAVCLVAFTVGLLGLYAASVYLIRRSRKLLAQAPTQRRWAAVSRKGFLWAVVGETVGIAVLITVCGWLQFYALIEVGIALVVGLHFFPLARIFRARGYYAMGAAITVWCIASVVLFRAQKMDVAAGIGTGAILWLTAAYNLDRSRRLLAASLASPGPATSS